MLFSPLKAFTLSAIALAPKQPEIVIVFMLPSPHPRKKLITHRQKVLRIHQIVGEYSTAIRVLETQCTRRSCNPDTRYLYVFSQLSSCWVNIISSFRCHTWQVLCNIYSKLRPGRALMYFNVFLAKITILCI